MAARRLASKILWIAASLGAILIFASALVSTLRRTRQQQACAAGQIAACFAACRRGEDTACRELERRCAAGSADACNAEQSVKEAQIRRARW
jgi:hypothetical protein